MKKIVDCIFAASVFVAAAFLAISCGNAPLKRKVPEKQPVKVRVQEVRSESNVSEKTYVARAAASKTTTVIAPFPSTLVSLKVSQGSRVKSGQTIAIVHSESVDNSLEAAKATLRQAQDAYGRIAKVKDNGSVAPMKIVEVETALARAEAAYNIARKSSADCVVKAPFSGTVSETYVENGEDLTLAQPIVKISDLDGMEILISVPESEISSMSLGRRAELTVPALSDLTVAAKVTRRGVVASPVSHSYECALETAGPVRGLMPGMVGKVVFESTPGAASSSKIVIPSSAVRTDEAGRYVWTVDEGNVVRKVNVTVDGFAGKGVVVSDGLSEGDRLIVDGCSKVSTGMKVVVEL